MPKFGTESIRAIALVGHGGAGKTTLAETFLATTGEIQNPARSNGGARSATSIPWKRSTVTPSTPLLPTSPIAIPTSTWSIPPATRIFSARR